MTRDGTMRAGSESSNWLLRLRLEARRGVMPLVLIAALLASTLVVGIHRNVQMSGAAQATMDFPHCMTGEAGAPIPVPDKAHDCVSCAFGGQRDVLIHAIAFALVVLVSLPATCTRLRRYSRHDLPAQRGGERRAGYSRAPPVS